MSITPLGKTIIMLRDGLGASIVLSHFSFSDCIKYLLFTNSLYPY